MPAYLVTLDRSKGGQTLQAGADAMVVFGADATAAKEIAAAKFPFEGDAWIDDGTAVEITAAADFEGWTFEIDIFGGFGAGNDEPASVSFTGTAGDNTVDEIAAQLVTLLNGLDGIAGAAYNATSNTLTIAETTDGLGDQAVAVRITPPDGESAIPSLVGTITDEGASGDALSVVLPADDAAIPQVVSYLRQAE